MTLRTIVDRAKSSSIFIAISVILVLLSSLITLVQGQHILRSFYYETIGYKSQLLGSLEKLSPEANIGYFENILGPAVFIRTLEKTATREYIFVNKLFYVQTLTDKDGRALAYSVTTRNENFNPAFVLPFCFSDFGSECRTKSVILGKTKFIELDHLFGAAQEAVSYVGAHNIYYSERYGGGNPGLYQTFAFSLNELGYIAAYPPAGPFGVVDIKNPEINRFRNEGVVNTYTVIGPFTKIEDFGESWVGEFIFGPDTNQVRVLPKE